MTRCRPWRRRVGQCYGAVGSPSCVGDSVAVLRAPHGAATTSTPTATPTPKPTPTGPRDGAYKASSSERYGTLTLTVTISGHRITAITAAYNSGSPQYCTTKACPTLRSEALAAQSANIATVSGATYTSDAYKAALAAVLKSAGERRERT